MNSENGLELTPQSNNNDDDAALLVSTKRANQENIGSKFGNSFVVLRSLVSLACYIAPIYFQNKDKKEFSVNDPKDILALALILISSSVTLYETITSSLASLKERQKVFSKKSNDGAQNSDLRMSAIELTRNTLAYLVLPIATVGNSMAIGISILNPTKQTNKAVFEAIRYFAIIGITAAPAFNSLDLLQYQNANDKSAEEERIKMSKTCNYASMVGNIGAAIAAVALLLKTDKSNEIQNTIIITVATTATKLWSSYLKNLMLPSDAKALDASYVVLLGVTSAFASCAPFFNENSSFVKSAGGLIAINAIGSQFDSVVTSFRGLIDSEIAKAMQKDEADKLLDKILPNLSESSQAEDPNIAEEKERIKIFKSNWHKLAIAEVKSDLDKIKLTHNKSLRSEEYEEYDEKFLNLAADICKSSPSTRSASPRASIIMASSQSINNNYQKLRNNTH